MGKDPNKHREQSTEPPNEPLAPPWKPRKGRYSNYNDPNPYANILERLWIIQNGLCFHCGKPMTHGKFGKDEFRWTREHVVPKATGGIRTKNIVLAHYICNLKRADRELTPEELIRANEILEKVKTIPHNPEADKRWNHRNARNNVR